MELKKNPKADLERLRSLWFNMALVASLTMVIMAFEWKFTGEGSTVDLSATTQDFEEILEIPNTQQPPPPPPKVVQPQITEVENEVIIEEKVEVDLDIEMEEDQMVDMVMATVPEPKEEVADEIFTIMETYPEFKGGMTAFYQFLQTNMRYPPQARQMGIEGKVFISMVVEQDGSLTNIEVAKGIGAGCDEEALRVLNMSPKWNPGAQRGRPVRARLIVPLFFKLD